MPRILVTGVTGFIARYAVPEFLAAGWDVQGLHRRADVTPPWPIVTRLCDLTGDPADVRDALAESRPDVVLHLAAMIPHDRVTAAWSWIESNGRATEQLLEACRDCAPMPRVIVVSSGAVYGSLEPGGTPFTEQCVPAPLTTYGVSKLLVEALAMRAGAAWDLPVVRVRLFNVTGPGEPPHQAIGRFARRLVEIERGLCAPVLDADDLSTERDFIDVRDAARGLFLAATRGEAQSVYNVCAGSAHRMSAVVEMLLGLTSHDGRIEVKGRSVGNDPIRSQCGSAQCLTALTGWTPARALRQTLADVLGECRVQQGAAARVEQL